MSSLTAEEVKALPEAYARVWTLAVLAAKNAAELFGVDSEECRMLTQARDVMIVACRIHLARTGVAA